MSAPWPWVVGSAALVSLASLVGVVFLLGDEDRLDTLLMYLVSLAAGVLLGGAFFHLIPEAAGSLGVEGLALPAYVLGGFLGFFFLERFLWAHHHGHGKEPVTREKGSFFHSHGHGAHADNPPTASVDRGSFTRPGDTRPRPVVTVNLVGNGFHSLVDGAILAAAYVGGGTGLGLVTTGAVLLHAVPQGAGNFGILVRGGLAPRRALLLNLLSTAAALVGAAAVLAVGTRILAVADAVVALTAGSFIYIAAADLIPELRHHHDRGESVGHGLLLLAGVAVMLALRFVPVG